MSEQLPCPRLELKWEDRDYGHECIYSLVLPLDDLDCRGNVEKGPRITEHKAEIGRTKRTGGEGGPLWKGEVDTPLRDGVHIQRDNKALGGHLPMFAIYKDRVTRIEVDNRKGR